MKAHKNPLNIDNIQDLKPRELGQLIKTGADLRKSALKHLREMADKGDEESQIIISNLSRKESLLSCAIYTGSFDPLTLGHKDVIRRASQIFDQVIVAIGVNPAKQGLFSKEEKIQIIKNDTKELGDSVRVISFTDAAIDAARREGARFIIRGVREATDFTEENKLALINREQTKGEIETLLIPADPNNSYVSSSTAKELVKLDMDTSQYLTRETTIAVRRKTFEPLLRKIWSEACKDIGIFNYNLINEMFAEIISTYCGTDRFYHDIRHIYRMLKLVEDNNLKIENKPAFILSIFFHDFVYNPKLKNNEELSAKACEEFLQRAEIDSTFIDKTNKLILATKKHVIDDPTDKDLALFIDLDLSILAASNEKYNRYADEIREEYSFVPERKYCAVRGNLMLDFAKREKIFNYPELIGVSNEQARANLKQEGDALLSRLPLREGPWHSRVIALTGSIGSGKSTVLSLLKDRGAFIISADDLVKELKTPGTKQYEEILNLFGDKILDSERKINNKALAQIVFNDPEAKSKLEEILHPAVLDLAKLKIEQAENQGEELLVFEVPLLFEANLDKLGFKHIISVVSDRETQLQRIIPRDNLSLEEAELRINSQLPIEYKILHSDFTLPNNGTVQELEERTSRLLDILAKI